MDIRQFRYLIALVREEHFTRAAEVCHVTQPTLSARIRALEEELGLAIVARGQRYHGLTPEGQRVYRWALKVVEDVDALTADVAMLAAEPRGRMTLGVIPSALPLSAALVVPWVVWTYAVLVLAAHQTWGTDPPPAASRWHRGRRWKDRAPCLTP